MQLTLEAGPAALLAISEPQPLRTGLRAVLPLLRVHTRDAHGNVAACPNCEARAVGQSPHALPFLHPYVILAQGLMQGTI